MVFQAVKEFSNPTKLTNYYTCTIWDVDLVRKYAPLIKDGNSVFVRGSLRINEGEERSYGNLKCFELWEWKQEEKEKSIPTVDSFDELAALVSPSSTSSNEEQEAGSQDELDSLGNSNPVVSEPAI